MKEEYVWESDCTIETVSERMKKKIEYDWSFSIKQVNSQLYSFEIGDQKRSFSRIILHEYPQLSGEVRLMGEGSRITAETKLNISNIFGWLLVTGFTIFMIILFWQSRADKQEPWMCVVAILMWMVYSLPLYISFYLRRNKRPYLELISRAAKAEWIRH